MGAKDRQIVRTLQQDGRLGNQGLAERVNLSPSPCLRRVRRLEGEGVIRGYAAVVDRKAMGLPVTAFPRVRLDRPGRPRSPTSRSRSGGMEEVLDCHLLTGDAEYLLRIAVAVLEGYERFVPRRMHRIDCIAALDTGFAHGVVRSGTMP